MSTHRPGKRTKSESEQDSGKVKRIKTEEGKNFLKNWKNSIFFNENN